MSRLAGIMAPGQEREIADLLRRKLCPKYQIRTSSGTGITVGQAFSTAPPTAGTFTCDGPAPAPEIVDRLLAALAAADIGRLGEQLLGGIKAPFALAAAVPGHMLLVRDPSGAIPLYLGTAGEALCYASELKLLHGWAVDIHPLPPGTFVLDSGEPMPFAVRPGPQPETRVTEAEWASCLRLALTDAVAEQGHDGCGVLLSGGLDSSAVAAMAAQAGYRCKAFTVAYSGGRDLEHAVMLAEHLGWSHYICRPSVDDLLSSLPEVLYRLESFDAPLVRSAVVNYQVNRLAADYVGAVLCGEGADELFAGYDFLGSLPREKLAGELDRLREELPDGGMQRVDRMAHAHGLEPRAPFLAPALVDLALAMPPEMKIGPGGLEKWILRRAMEGLLPAAIVERRKEKFSVGCGSAEILARVFAERIGDDEFLREKALPDGSELRSKEELHYYRLFREEFGEDLLPLVGRTRI